MAMLIDTSVLGRLANRADLSRFRNTLPTGRMNPLSLQRHQIRGEVVQLFDGQQFREALWHHGFLLDDNFAPQLKVRLSWTCPRWRFGFVSTIPKIPA